MITMMLGTLSCGFLADAVGRRMTLLVSVVIILVAWVVIYLATGFPVILISRAVNGFGAGIIQPAGYLILSEISLVR